MKHSKATKKKISKSLKKYFNTHVIKESTRKKLSKKLKKHHKKYPNKWKRTIQEKLLMSQRMKKYLKQHPKATEKCSKAMLKANLKRKYPKMSKKQKQLLSKQLKGRKAWNEGLKTGLIPSTAFKSGKNHPQYIKNLVRKYPLKFNKELKELIRIRDNYQCQICGKLQKNKKLSVHHIDYNKENLDSKNLISLCKICHCTTNFNRETHIEYFKILTKIIW